MQINTHVISWQLIPYMIIPQQVIWNGETMVFRKALIKERDNILSVYSVVVSQKIQHELSQVKKYFVFIYD